MYKAGQKIKVILPLGYKNSNPKVYDAEVVSVSKANNWANIRIHLPGGGFKKMFGCVSELEKLEVQR